MLRMEMPMLVLLFQKQRSLQHITIPPLGEDLVAELTKKPALLSNPTHVHPIRLDAGSLRAIRSARMFMRAPVLLRSSVYPEPTSGTLLTQGRIKIMQIVPNV